MHNTQLTFIFNTYNTSKRKTIGAGLATMGLAGEGTGNLYKVSKAYFHVSSPNYYPKFGHVSKVLGSVRNNVPKPLPPNLTSTSSTNSYQTPTLPKDFSLIKPPILSILKSHQELSKGLNTPSLSETIKNNSYLQGQSKVSTSVTSPKDQEIGKEVHTRNYPGKGYTGYDHSKSVIFTASGQEKKVSNLRTTTGKELPQHEGTHTNIIDNETGLAVGITTSCKKPDFIPLSIDNFKNQVVTTNGPSKTQQIGLFDQPKKFENGSIVENKDATAHLKKHELLLDEILIKHPVSSAFNVPQKRVHKDSPSLYNENGQPIFDINGDEI